MATVLFAAAHPDDETLAMGVAIAEHVAAGHDVHLLWLTRGEDSIALDYINGDSPSGWWVVPHHPDVEGYAPLDPESFGAARIAEATAAVRALTSGLGSVTLHEAGLADGSLTSVAVRDVISDLADEIAPGSSPVRLKAHTWVPQLDVHPDHLAAGSAVKALATADPSRFGDRRHYLLPGYWADPDLTLVSEVTDNPANGGIAARAVNAARSFAAWAPDRGSYAIGMHSRPDWFATVTQAPKCVFHP